MLDQREWEEKAEENPADALTDIMREIDEAGHIPAWFRKKHLKPLLLAEKDRTRSRAISDLVWRVGDEGPVDGVSDDDA